MLDQAMLLAQDETGIFAGGLILLVWFVLAVLFFGIWVWALISAIQNPALDSTMRIVWVLVIVFTGIIGAAIYLLVGRGGASTASTTSQGTDHL